MWLRSVGGINWKVIEGDSIEGQHENAPPGEAIGLQRKGRVK
jgi:hypothetical protein